MRARTISAQLAEFYSNVKYEDIPLPIIEKTKRHILDTFGAGLAGSLSDEQQKLRSVREMLGRSAGDASLWGAGQAVDPLDAALINGVACHTFELDDTGGCDHSGAVVLPAAMASLPLCGRRVSGREFIAAIVLGYDMARRALESCGCYEPHNEAGWHSTSTCGPFGAAVAAGYLLKLTEEELQSAIGIASSTSGGLWAFIHDGAQNKRLHPGRAAEGGLLAALLAKQGFRGAKLALEDVWGGFSKTFAPRSEDRTAWTKDIGVNWKIGRVSIKPYTSCRSTHAAMDAVSIMMKEHDLKNYEIEEIIVELNPFVNGMCGGRETSTMTGTQMSLPYGIAAIAVYGSAGLDCYTENMRNSEKVHQVMDRVKLIVDDAMASDEEPIVTIQSKNGERHRLRVEMPLGSPTNPITDEALLQKYDSIATMLWPKSIANQFAQSILSLESVLDMNEIERVLKTLPFEKEIIR